MPDSDGANLSMAEIETRVKHVVVEQLGIDEAAFAMYAEFEEEYAADYLEVFELVMAFEEEFGIELGDSEAEYIITPRRACDVIEAHLRNKPTI